MKDIDWEEITAILKVNLFERFKIEISDSIVKDSLKSLCGLGYDLNKVEFCLSGNGLVVYPSDSELSLILSKYTSDVFYSIIVLGVLKKIIRIKRKNFIPKEGENYYYVFMTKDKWDISSANYSSASYFDHMNFASGNCFRTPEDALESSKELYSGFLEKIEKAERYNKDV